LRRSDEVFSRAAATAPAFSLSAFPSNFFLSTSSLLLMWRFQAGPAIVLARIGSQLR
jgi:hypothetical protein